MSITQLNILKTFSATRLKAVLLIAVLGSLSAVLPANLTHINTSLSALPASTIGAQL